MPILHSTAVAHLGRACPEMKALGEKFRPHRSTAAWYFWRATGLARLPGLTLE